MVVGDAREHVSDVDDEGVGHGLDRPERVSHQDLEAREAQGREERDRPGVCMLSDRDIILFAFNLVVLY